MYLAHNIQIVVVTHKQGLFSKSESLVGVSRPKSLNFSQVYSLKLSEDWLFLQHKTISKIIDKIISIRLEISYLVLRLMW